MRSAKLRSVTRAALGAAVLLLGAGAWASDPPPQGSGSQAVPSKEVREKMATLHEQMAACLRSDKSFAECRTEMMQSCQGTVGAQGCRMMGMGRGMGRGCPMQPPPASAPK
jgi:hypothetical protein